MSDETTTDHSEVIERARERMGKHTEGEWSIGWKGGKYLIYAESGEIVVWPSIDGVGVMAKNAYLIIDAPDLNTALVALADERDALRVENERLRAISQVGAVTVEYEHDLPLVQISLMTPQPLDGRIVWDYGDYQGIGSTHAQAVADLFMKLCEAGLINPTEAQP